MVITVLIVAFTGVENAPSQRSRPFSNGKEQRMFKRRRFKQNLSLSERLMQDVERLRLQLAMCRPALSETTSPSKFVKMRQPPTSING